MAVEHPSLIQQKEKTLRDELKEVAENAVRTYLQEKAKVIAEAQNDPEILQILDQINQKLDLKNSNLELEKEVLLKLNRELGK